VNPGTTGVTRYEERFYPRNELLFLALGGSGEIGMNVNLYGCQGKWIMVDLGMTFSGTPDYPGIDLVLADLSSSRSGRTT
jgi:ribonuclease J